MNVAECMSRNVEIADPELSLQQAAHAMASNDAGMLLIGEGDRLTGVITDRDMAIRGFGGGGCVANTPVREVMSKEVLYCRESDPIGEVLQNMGEVQLRRLPVLDADKRLVGVVALSDPAKNGAADATGLTLTRITQPSSHHSQEA